MMAKIKKLEGLLAYAVAHGEFEEAERVRVLDSSLPSRRSTRSESRRLVLGKSSCSWRRGCEILKTHWGRSDLF